MPYFAAKFNCMVPGTVSNSTAECPTITTDRRSTLEAITSQSPSPTTATPTEESQVEVMRNKKDNQLALETGSPLFYGVVVAGSVIIVILLLCMIGVTILGCRRRGYKCGE